MSKELYLYSGIYPFTAQALIEGMEEAGEDSVTIRINSPGGDVFAGWGIVAKMTERTAPTKVKVDGCAMSMAVMPVVFSNDVECTDVSTFMIHRAAMTVENDEDQAFLDDVNKNLRAKLESKIDSNVLMEVTKAQGKYSDYPEGISIANLFEDEKRIDLLLNAKEAKKIRLVNKINKLTPELQAEMSAMNKYKVAATAATETDNPKQTSTKMTLAELKEKHPELYAEVRASGKKSAINAEKDRIGSWMAFNSVDPKAVAEGIQSGKKISATHMSEFTMKAASGKHLQAIGAENAEATHTATDSTDPSAKPEDRKKALAQAEFDKTLDNLLKNKNLA